MGWLNANGIWIGRNSGSWSPKTQELIDQTVIDLKTALGITLLSDAFCFLYLLANEGTEAWRLNLIKRAHDITQHGGTQTEDGGWQGNGTNAYLDTNFNPATQGGTVYTLNNASLGIYSLTNVAETTCDIGCRTTAKDYTAILSKLADTGGSSTRMHSGISSIVDGLVSSTIGMFAVGRNASTLTGLHGWVNKIEMEESGSGESTNIPSANVFIGARGFSGTPELFSSRKYAFAWGGKYFTHEQIGLIYDVLVSSWL